jgi:hypothetical protein
MAEYHAIATALICAAMAACATSNTTTPPGIQSLMDQRRAAIVRLGDETLQPLSQWQQETPPTCGSPSLAKARTAVLMTAGLLTPERSGVDAVIEGGTWVLQFADTARDHGCKDTARSLYDTVIATYTGSAYAALRQRAQIGIGDLRP